LVTKVFEFRHKKIREHIGGIYEFLSRRKIESLAELNKKAAAIAEPEKKDLVSGNKQAFINKKEFDREVRKFENSIAKVEGRIGELEAEIGRFESRIANPGADEGLNSPDFYDHYNKMQTEMKEQMAVWEQLQNDLEVLKNKKN